MYKTSREVTACDEDFSRSGHARLHQVQNTAARSYAMFISWKRPAGTSAPPGFVGSLLTPVPQPSAYQERPASAKFRHGGFGRI